MVDSWKYVAGFFDGEGCVWWCVGRSVAQASMSQKLPEVLYQIQEFLKTQGIKSSMRTTNRNNRKIAAHSLEVQGWTNVVPFLKGVLPYLQTIKKIVAQDILRTHILLPQMNTAGRSVLVKESFAAKPVGEQSASIQHSWIARRRKALKPTGWAAHRLKYGCECQHYTGSCQKLVAA